ncbi:MAG: response regulator [Planctomycetota bacterium]
MRVLVVAGSSEERQRVRHWLSRTPELADQDFEVLEAHTGRECLSLCKLELPDLLLVDNDLRDLDAVELLWALSDMTFDAPAVVILTEHADVDLTARAFKSGALDVFRKDQVSPEKLYAAIRRCEDRLRLRRQLQQKRAALASAREEAERAQRATSNFVSKVSHELRTPLTAVLGYVDLIVEDLDEIQAPATIRAAAETVRAQGAYMLSLINDLLDYSKMQAGCLDVEWAEVSLVDLLGQVRDLLHHMASSKGLQLEIIYLTPVPEVIRTDSLRLRQILVNLVNNAIKFSDHGSVLVLVHFATAGQLGGGMGPDLDPEDGILDCTVIDSGIGITEEQQARLFTPFRQGDAGISRRYGGTGLGLPIARELAQRLGGDIQARSRPCRGSAFRCRVRTGPLGEVALVDPTAPSPSDPPAARSMDGLPPRILLVEDTPVNRELIVAVLQRAGLSVTTEEDGQVALERIETAAMRGEDYDVILMDLNLPGLLGSEVTRRLRARGYAGKIVAITASTEMDIRRVCFENGFDDCLEKPIDRTHLVDTVCSYLERQEA